jgi:hypothetical protein
MVSSITRFFVGLVFASVLLDAGWCRAEWASCVRTIVIGDSQMAYGVTPFRMMKTFDGEEFRDVSNEAFGTWMFRYFAGTDCADSTFLYSQGGSGVFDWLGEAQVEGKPFPAVRFLGGSRMILQPGFAWMTDYSSRLSTEAQEWVKIPSLRELVSASHWVRPDRIVIALSANDWWVDEAELVKKYRELLAIARGGEHQRECVLVGVVGVKSKKSKALRRKEDPPAVTDQNVQKLVRMGKLAAQAEECRFIDLSRVEPGEPDGLHIGGLSAWEAFVEFKLRYERRDEDLMIWRAPSFIDSNTDAP